jgi:MFS family permease
VVAPGPLTAVRRTLSAAWSRRPLESQTARVTAVTYDLLAAAFILAALVVALRTTRDLESPHDPDHFRDIAQAQAVLDGHPLSDPYYRGEWAWYNPLLAWTIALGAGASGTTVERFHVRSGPWLNLFGPIAFYVLAVRLAGRRAALGGLAIYLFFLCGNEHSWASATYSPWLFAGNFSQGIFFSTALALLWAQKCPTPLRALAVGALIGVAFLAHTAPALILAVMAAAVFLPNWRSLGIAAAAALAVASPFLVGILAYRFQILNPAPIVYVYPPVSTERFGETLQRYAPAIGASLLGLLVAPSRLIGAWLAAALALTAYTILPVTALVPAFHFWLYTTAALALLTGAALARLCPRPFIFASATVAFVVWNWTAYTGRADIRVGRYLATMRVPDHITASAFLRTVTRPDDVVLGAYGAVRLIIGPAGRKTLAPDPLFENRTSNMRHEALIGTACLPHWPSAIARRSQRLPASATFQPWLSRAARNAAPRRRCSR